MAIVHHINNMQNPHQLSKWHVNLGNIREYPLASRDDILALERDDVYIDITANEFVTDAFAHYLVKVGLVDHTDRVKVPPSDPHGDPTFALTSEGQVVLEGKHPDAVAVKVRIYNDQELLLEVPETPVVFDAWSLDVNDLGIQALFGLPADQRPEQFDIKAIVEYMGDELYPLSRNVRYIRIPTQNLLKFSIASDSGLFKVEGIHKDVHHISVFIKDLDTNQIVYTEEKIFAFDSNHWTTNANGLTIDIKDRYEITVKGFIYDTEVFHTTTNVLEDFTDLGTQRLYDTNLETNYVDMREYQYLTNEDLVYIDLNEGV
ncbi:MAG: hypothetical protein IBX57_00970 [Gammaproteobacteria bacterium]|nr:hypothetical protein [Gammaproteobacteria bacterium]